MKDSGGRECRACCQATLAAWREVERGDPAALPIYQARLERLLVTANRCGCLDPRGRLVLAGAGACQVVPISYCGFPWRAADFCEILPASDFNSHGLERCYRRSGVGVSLVAVRHSGCQERFLAERQAFPVTAVLRPSQGGAVLEFYNPLVFDSLQVGPALLSLDCDLTAPLVYWREDTPRRYVTSFLDPGDFQVRPKLVMMEPYQPGKIPVVFIHGLGSDPLTWADAIGGLWARRDIYPRYQFWYFRYPTGGDLLDSAAALRESLAVARETSDPNHADPALDQAVLVGHSMGGLVARLQVACSYDLLWNKIARRPLECLRTTPEVREQWRRNFYFDPSLMVKRVVFIATPHRGSNVAQRLVGRAASHFVHYSPEEEAAYRRLMDDNRDVFTDYLVRRKPTAVDLLAPDNPLLEAMAQMPFARCVRLHSIIGDPFPTLDGQGSDGVVPVSSAHLATACSERFLCVKHERTNKTEEAVAELERILREHVVAFSGGVK